MKTVVKLFLLVALAPLSCKQNTIEQPIAYNGPLIEVDTVQTLYSDSAILRVKLNAPKEYEFLNGNREFPKGINIVFFNEYGARQSTLVANWGYYDKEKDVYTGKGNVIIRNLLENKELLTEELHWNPTHDRIYNDTTVQVQIKTPEQTLYGKGMETNQEFTKYKILKPVGKFTVNEAP